MSNSWDSIYQSKVMTAQEAVERLIPDGSSVFIGGLSIATHTINVLMDNIKKGAPKGITFHGNLIMGEVRFDDPALTPDKFRYHCFFAGPYERAGAKFQSVDFVPVHFSSYGRYMDHVKPDICIVPMSPPDDKGYCNVGPLGFNNAALRNTKIIIAQISKEFPRVYGSEHDIHVNDIAAFVEYDELPALTKPTELSDTDRKIAEYIVDRIPDGACIQLGIGGVANAVGFGLRSKKHLGVHSEMYTESMAELQREGIIDNSRKTFMPGRSVAGFTLGGADHYKYIAENPKVYFTPYEYVNNLQNIRANDNMVSINTAISIDLTGQVCAESLGFRQYSGSGGQVDYIRGAAMSKGGQSFIAVSSVAHTKNGPKSKIVLDLDPGSVVTSLRAEIQYIVTEYGCADLRFCDIPTRAKRLISIAHPDFRDELTFQAKKNGYLY